VAPLVGVTDLCGAVGFRLPCCCFLPRMAQISECHLSSSMQIRSTLPHRAIVLARIMSSAATARFTPSSCRSNGDTKLIIVDADPIRREPVHSDLCSGRGERRVRGSNPLSSTHLRRSEC
jgi:hypothetical protein